MVTKVLAGLTVDIYKGVKPSRLLKQIRRIGVEFAEVTINIFQDLESAKQEIKGLKLGLHLPIISEDGFDFACVEKKEKIDEIIEHINLNWRDLNFQYVLSHPTEKHLFKTEFEVSEEFLFENLKKIEPPVIIENTFENNNFHFDDFIDRSEKLLGEHLAGICFDGPHAFISRDNWFELLEKYIDKIKLVHLSDCTKEKDLHIPFGGEGKLPVERILQFLKNKNYNGIVNLELRPKSLTELEPIFNSYLLILRYLNRRKFFSMRLKSAVLLPLIHKHFK